MYIYKITNLINNKVYIGQTTRCYKIRFKEHIESALYDKTKNTYLYKSIKKHGKENFIIEVIEKVDDLNLLNEREVFYINHFNSINPFGYNYLPGGKNNYKLSEQHILNISNPIKATNSITGENYYFISLTLPNSLGFSSGSVSVAIKDNKIYKGYFWKKISKEEYLNNKFKNDIKKIPKFYAKNIETGKTTIIYYGDKLKDYGFNSTKVGPILKGHYGRKTHKGYIFSFNPF